VEAKFFAPVQTSPGAYPAGCTRGTGSFPEVKEVEALKKECSYSSIPLCALMAGYRVNYTSYITLLVKYCAKTLTVVTIRTQEKDSKNNFMFLFHKFNRSEGNVGERM
jgi:hypothetical protein